MTQLEETTEKRQKTLAEIMRGTVPRLWCPPVTHYLANGALDRDRMEAHWAFMTPHVNAFLLPGSTSDGWEMTEDEVSSLLNFGLELAEKYDAHLLIGVLRTTASLMCETISKTLEHLKKKTGIQDPIKALKQSRGPFHGLWSERRKELATDAAHRDTPSWKNDSRGREDPEQGRPCPRKGVFGSQNLRPFPIIENQEEISNGHIRGTGSKDNASGRYQRNKKTTKYLWLLSGLL